jgi:hypothetical protein
MNTITQVALLERAKISCKHMMLLFPKVHREFSDEAAIDLYSLSLFAELLFVAYVDGHAEDDS